MKWSCKQAFDLSGKSAIVTGGAGFLGRCFCAALAEFGAVVAVVDLNQETVEELAADLTRTYGTKCIGLACDVSSEKEVKEMVRETVHRFRKIDILHNNAATKTEDRQAFFTRAEDYSISHWRQVMAVNMEGMFLVAKNVGREMIHLGRGGSIIQTSSIYGMLGPDPRIYSNALFEDQPMSTPPVYSAAKAGVIGLTRYLATCWAPYGIRVNTLTPGGIGGGQNEIFQSQYAARVPLARMGRPEELAGALIFLASGASSYITGANIVVDGGLSAW